MTNICLYTLNLLNSVSPTFYNNFLIIFMHVIWNLDENPRGTQQSFYREALPQGPIPYLSYIILTRKGSPFVYLKQELFL